MKTKTLSTALLHKRDAYQRAANYPSVGQNLFVEEHIKQRRYRPGELFV